MNEVQGDAYDQRAGVAASIVAMARKQVGDPIIGKLERTYVTGVTTYAPYAARPDGSAIRADYWAYAVHCANGAVRWAGTRYDVRADEDPTPGPWTVAAERENEQRDYDEEQANRTLLRET